MRLLDYIDQLQMLYAKIGNADIRFTGLHNTYSPETTVITTYRPLKEGETERHLVYIFTGNPINAWPLPEMKLSPEVEASL